MRCYKLTDQQFKTRAGYSNELTWGEGITHSVEPSNNNPDLCSGGWIHYYSSPLIAVLLNPLHAKIKNPILWECVSFGEHKHEALKHGCKKLTTVKQIPLPKFTTVNKIAFGILCALEVDKSEEFSKWANNWLNNVDRSSKTAANAANAAADAAYDAANDAAANAVANAANAAAYAANAAAYAANAAYAATRSTKINFVKLAKQALKIK